MSRLKVQCDPKRTFFVVVLSMKLPRPSGVCGVAGRALRGRRIKEEKEEEKRMRRVQEMRKKRRQLIGSSPQHAAANAQGSDAPRIPPCHLRSVSWGLSELGCMLCYAFHAMFMVAQLQLGGSCAGVPQGFSDLLTPRLSYQVGLPPRDTPTGPYYDTTVFLYFPTLMCLTVREPVRCRGSSNSPRLSL